MLAGPYGVYAQQTKKPTPNSQAIEGTVIGTDGTKYWSGFKIESGGKEYTFVTEYNAKQGTNPTIVGGKCCGIGMRVRVAYKGSPNRYLLDVTQILVLSSTRMPQDTGVNVVPATNKSDSGLGQTSVPLVSPPAPRMTKEDLFFYRLARDAHGVSDAVVDEYGKAFDENNYRKAMADEFERTKYKEGLRARVESGLSRADFNRRFSLVESATLGEYVFERHSFPMVLSSGDTTGVNGYNFDWVLPMSEIDANAFVKKRSGSYRGVDRRIYLRITYSIVNQKPPWSGFLYFFHSIEAFADEGITQRLGAIPKQNLPGSSTSEEWRSAQMSAQAARGTTRTNSIGMELVYIRPGTFLIARRFTM
jgi:hypothetical protein